MMTKDEIRALMRCRRRELSSAERAQAAERICQRFIAMELASPIAVYLASPDEIDLAGFITHALSCGKTLYAPRWNGDNYDLARLDGLDGRFLRRGPMNIMEPLAENIIHPSAIRSWLVPGLAFSTSGDRIGYGGGWYDRLLAMSSPSALRLAVAYDFQIVDSLPVEEHDMKVRI